MTEPSTSTARAALDELLDVSPQVDAVVLLKRDGGELLAAAPDSARTSATTFAGHATQLLEAADVARRELGREPVAQVEVATRDGHVFVVSDAEHVVAAVTDADPTVGLVFYDLKTALRAMRETSALPTGTSSANGIVTPVIANGDADTGESTGRWKRRKS